MKKPTKRTTKAAQMQAEIDKAVAHTRNLVDKYELDYYLDGLNIKGELVDESDDITPEQVAILGAYTMAAQLQDKLTTITGGKTPAKSAKLNIKGAVLDMKTGKMEEVNEKTLPKEVRDELRKFLDEMENK